jgi:hypothetical protein
VSSLVSVKKKKKKERKEKKRGLVCGESGSQCLYSHWTMQSVKKQEKKKKKFEGDIRIYGKYNIFFIYSIFG